LAKAGPAMRAAPAAPARRIFLMSVMALFLQEQLLNAPMPRVSKERMNAGSVHRAAKLPCMCARRGERWTGKGEGAERHSALHALEDDFRVRRLTSCRLLPSASVR